MNELSKDESLLNDVYAIKCSETDLMEANCKYQHYYNKTGDPQVLEEGLISISDIVKKMTSSYKKGITAFSSSTKKDLLDYAVSLQKYAKKHESTIKNLQSDLVNFYVDGYNFSVLDVKRIDLSELYELLKQYDEFVKNFSRGTVEGSLEAISQSISGYMSDKNLVKVRSSMLGAPGDCEISEFLTTIKKLYRGGTAKKEPVHVTKEYILRIINDIPRIQKDMQETLNESDTISKEYHAFLNNVSSMIEHLNSISKKDGDFSNPEIVKKYVNVMIQMRDRYSEVVSSAVMIVNDRISALRELTAQSMEILTIAVVDVPRRAIMSVNDEKTPVLKKYSQTPNSTHPVFSLEATDYTEITLEQMILQESSYSDLMENRYLAESEFISSCLESNLISQELMEAGNFNQKYQAIKETIIKFLEKLIAAVRGKAVEYNKRYVKWLNDVGEDNLKKSAQTMKSVTLAPYFDGADVSGDLRDIQTAINNASSNNDKNNLSFTKAFIDDIKTADDYNNIRGDLSGYLKNYFRFHKKNAKSVEKVEISGNDLSGKISDMVTYITNYEKNAAALEKLKNTFESALRSMGDNGVMDSFSYLQLEDIPASASDLTLLEGYSLLLEAKENDKDKSGVVTNDKGEVESATSIQTSDQQEKEEAKKNGEAGTSSARYINIFQNFFQLVISSYVTAMEERYITYVNILAQLAGGRPKVDDKGNYVPNDKKPTEVKEAFEGSTIPQSYYNKLPEMKGLSLYK